MWRRTVSKRTWKRLRFAFVTTLFYCLISSMASSQKDTSLSRLSLLAVAYLHRGRRQDQKWIYRQALTNTALKVSLRMFTALHIRPYLSLKPNLEAKRFVLIEPTKPELYIGVVVDEQVKPETIGGTWYLERLSPETLVPKGEYVVLQLYSGSYVLGDGRTASCRFLASNFLSHTPATYMFCLQYRLAVDPRGRFLAQL
jgi:hypothetical protein